MKVVVVGTGYVGLVTGVCFADVGNDVQCVDIDSQKVDSLNNGGIPIYEPGLSEIAQRNRIAGRLHFTTSLEAALKKADICFIAVGTPMSEDGRADLQYVLKVAESIGKYMVRSTYVVNKSTVPVGTAQKVRQTIEKQLADRKCNLPFHVISNPEFLKEGSAVDDFLHPDRVVIGTDSDAAKRVMSQLYRPFIQEPERMVFMDAASAEMTKYTANCMLANKISFMNEISHICEAVGADINKVRLGIGSDKRIGFSFINVGCGYGGSCFPKDVKALIKTSHDHGYSPRILESVELVNNEQKLVIPAKITVKYGEDLSGYTFGCWGLAFKPETDDMRMAPSIVIIKELVMRGAAVKVYDPKVSKEAVSYSIGNDENVFYCHDKYEALAGCDAMIVVTEWKEFRIPDFRKMKSRLKKPVIFDGRNLYDAPTIEKLGFEYYQIGVGCKPCNAQSKEDFGISAMYVPTINEEYV